jgi:hypothetical protein
MIGTIPIGQLVGGLIETFLISCGGVYLVWIRPYQVQQKVKSGKISEAEGQEKLRKLNPKLGYLLFVVSVCQLFVQLSQWFSHT